MEKILDRFLRYVAVDTQSDPTSETQPSAAKELDLLKILKDLKMEYKDVLFFTIIREMSTKEFGELLDQTDRNIRKKRMRLLNRIREELYEGLKDRKNLSFREKQFLERFKNNALAKNEDAEDDAEKRCAG